MAYDTLSPGYTEARGLLEVLTGVYFGEYIPEISPTPSLRKAQEEQASTSLFESYSLPETESSGLVLKNYPNPFTHSTFIEVQSEEAGIVVITDLLGREIKRVPHFKGTSLLELNDDELNSGTYLYSFEVNGHKLSVKKMIKL